MTVRIGPVELRINAFLFLLGVLIEGLRQLSHNEEFKAKLKEEVEKAQAKKQAKAPNLSSMFGTDASGKTFSGANADEIISQMFPNKAKSKRNA